MSSPHRALFVLVHSPLVGPSTWWPVATELRRRGFDAIVPNLGGDDRTGQLYWQKHSHAAAAALRGEPADRPLILCGHSGAGVLLPPIAYGAGRPVAAYLFVD